MKKARLTLASDAEMGAATSLPSEDDWDEDEEEEAANEAGSDQATQPRSRSPSIRRQQSSGSTASSEGEAISTQPTKIHGCGCSMTGEETTGQHAPAVDAAE